MSIVPRSLTLEPFAAQRERWPREGRHILAHANADTIVVYQAYRPEIGHFAAEHRQLGGPLFKFERMSWIKTSFLWMMYRSGWATKEHQECVLAIHLRRDAFEEILSQTVPSKFVPALYSTPEDWSTAVRHSNVRLQWDPDRLPGGQALTRRAIQLGLQGSVLRRFATEWITDIEDITAFVREQRQHVGGRSPDLLMPRETEYVVRDEGTARRLGIVRE